MGVSGATLITWDGSSIVLGWLNTFFRFDPEGNVTITDQDGNIVFQGGELDLLDRLKSADGVPK